MMEKEMGGHPPCDFVHNNYPTCDCLEPGEFPIGDGRNACIFHWDPESPQEKEIKARIFEDRFKKLITDFERGNENEKKENPLNFHGFVFPPHFDFLKNKKILTLNFAFTKFYDYVSFEDAAFESKVSFVKAKFGSHANFKGAQFGDNASFEMVEFGPFALFEDARFGERAYFYLAKFGGRVSFREATFGDRARFRESTFRGALNFTGAIFGGDIAFSGIREKHRFVFEGTLNDPVNFQRVRFKRPEFVQFSTVNLRSVSFFNTDVSRANFVDVDWLRESGAISFLGRVLEDNIGNFHFEQRPLSMSTLRWLERLCQQLKLNYENQRNYADAGDFHWAEMEYRRQRHWMNKEWLPAVMLGAYKWLAGYGERIPRAATVLFAALLLAVFLQGRFGVFHAPKWVRPPGEAACVLEDDRPFRILQDPPLIEDPCVDRAASWYEAYYQAGKFTLQDVTFQKPEEQYPASPFGRGLSLFMRFFFPIQLGLLFVAIKRRFRR